MTNAGNIAWSLSGPGGVAVSNRQFTVSDGSNISTSPALPLPAGTYSLTIASLFGQAGGAYSFRLSDLASATTFAPGTAVSGTLNPANSSAFYQFNAGAGQSFYFAQLSGGNSIWWRLIDPYGNVLFSTFEGNDAGRLTLAAGGTYTVLIEGALSNTGALNYSFNVAPIADPTQALALGSTVNGTLSAPGEKDSYAFTLPSNSLLYFDSLTNSGNLQWSLTGPTGTVVSNRLFNNSDALELNADPVLALPLGDYTLTVVGSGQTTGAYSFRLSSLATASMLTPGTPVSGTLNPANSTVFYQFNATAGQSFYFAQQSGSTNVWWRLIDPYGNMLFSTFQSNDAGRLTLTASGVYTVLVEGRIGSTGTSNYSFNVAPIADTTQALTLGNLVSGSLSAPGQQDHYTFTLPATEQLYFDSLTNNGGIQWSLTGPMGLVVNQNTFSTTNAFNSSDSSDLNGNPVLVLPPGTYTLTVSATGQTTGAYSFRLSDLSTATALTPGTPVSGTLNPANSSQFYQFNAAAAQAFYFARLSGSGGSSGDRWRLIDPYGNMLFSNPLGNDGGRLTLGAAGTYTVLVEGEIRDTGTAAYSFNVAPITDKTQALTLGSAVNSSLAAPGEQDRYTFNLAAGSQLYFDSLTNSGTFQWSLTGPTGTVISNRLFNNSDALELNADPVLALPPGDYTLTVVGSGQTTGAYSFRLSDLAEAAPLTPGTQVSGTLNPANSTAIYKFNLVIAGARRFYFAQQSGQQQRLVAADRPLRRHVVQHLPEQRRRPADADSQRRLHGVGGGEDRRHRHGQLLVQRSADCGRHASPDSGRSCQRQPGIAGRARYLYVQRGSERSGLFRFPDKQCQLSVVPDGARHLRQQPLFHAVGRQLRPHRSGPGPAGRRLQSDRLGHRPDRRRLLLPHVRPGNGDRIVAGHAGQRYAQSSQQHESLQVHGQRRQPVCLPAS